MLNPTELDKINSIIESMEESIKGEVEQERTHPQDIFDELFMSEDSPISVNDIVERAFMSSKTVSGKDGADYYFGIDASTTKTIETMSGVTFCVSNAKTGVTDRSFSKSNFDIDNESTIVIGIEDKNDVIEKEKMKDKVRKLSDKYTDVYAVFVDKQKDFDESSSRVKNVSRTKAESVQLSKTVDATGDSSIIYLDGSVYPRSLVRPVISSKNGIKDEEYAEVRILKDYIDCIKRSSSPIVGVVKNPRSEEILRSYSYITGIDPQSLKWKDDYTLMVSYLRNKDEYKKCFYTSEWFTQNSRVVGNKKKDISWIYDENFRRNFFYCHLVSEAVTIRFETLSGFIQGLDSGEELMKDCVADVVMSNGIPESVRMADEKANISYKNSEKIGRDAKDSLRSIVKRYNRDERNYEGDY